MIKKKYLDGDATREAILHVATQMGDRVGNTLGPGGRNYMTMGGITNDGVSILDEIRFDNEGHDAIADAFVEVAKRQDKDAGDATTTATVLATKLVSQVLADVSSIDLPFGKTVMEIKAQLEEELVTALAYLEDESSPVDDLEQLINVAKTAMEGHPSSQLIAQTVYAVGFNSNISLEDGFDNKVTSTMTPGVHYPLKIESAAMFTNVTRKEAIIEEPLVVVANHVFESFLELSPFFTSMVETKRQNKEKPQPLVVIAKQFSMPFTAQVTALSKKLGLPILLLTCQGLKDEEMMDMAEYTGGRYIDTHPKTGMKMTEYLYKDVGMAAKVIAGPKQTALVAGAGIATGQVSIRVAELTTLAETEQSPIYREELRRRAAGLDGGVATVYVDAKTAVDRYYLKKKVEDAVNSCKAALEFGTIAGGGTALLKVGLAMPDDSYLGRTLPEIYNRVQKNAGGKLNIDQAVVRDAFYANKCALENAVAVIKILVTLEGVIVDAEHSLVEDLGAKLGYEG